MTDRKPAAVLSVIVALTHFMFPCIILVLIVKISVTRDLSEASHKIHQLYFSSGARAQSSEYSYSLIDCFSLALS